MFIVLHKIIELREWWSIILFYSFFDRREVSRIEPQTMNHHKGGHAARPQSYWQWSIIMKAKILIFVVSVHTSFIFRF